MSTSGTSHRSGRTTGKRSQYSMTTLFRLERLPYRQGCPCNTPAQAEREQTRHVLRPALSKDHSDPWGPLPPVACSCKSPAALRSTRTLTAMCATLFEACARVSCVLDRPTWSITMRTCIEWLVFMSRARHARRFCSLYGLY